MNIQTSHRPVVIVAALLMIMALTSLACSFSGPRLGTVSSLVDITLTQDMFQIAILAVRSMPRLQTLLTNIQDRVLVMLFIYVPMGLLALMVVMYRNLL